MNRRHHFQVLVFSFTLLMILLRPYAAYQIAGRPALSKNPAKVNELLQRLVKKKDEHHALSDNELIAIQQPRTGQVLPVLLRLFTQNLVSAIVAGIGRFRTASYNSLILFHNKHYLRFAQLRI